MKIEKCPACKSEIPRMNGKTTRAVDKVIQELFEYGHADLIENNDIPCKPNFRMVKYFENRVFKRLALEHPLVEYTLSKDFLNNPPISYNRIYLK